MEERNFTGFRGFPDFIKSVSESKYKELESYYKLLDGISRITHRCFYLVDFFKGKVLYVSDNPLFLCGLKPNEVMALNGDFTSSFMTQDRKSVG